jgi:hypothetical protein
MGIEPTGPFVRVPSVLKTVRATRHLLASSKQHDAELTLDHYKGIL